MLQSLFLSFSTLDFNLFFWCLKWDCKNKLIKKKNKKEKKIQYGHIVVQGDVG